MYFSKILVEVFCCLLGGLRPLFGPARCRYAIGCTKFTMHRLRSQPLQSALKASIRRLGSCASWQPLRTDLFE